MLTGCSVNYNLVITNDETIKENFTINVDNEIIYDSGMEIDEFLDYYSHLYQQNEGYENFKIETKEGKFISSFIVKNDYKSLNDYIESFSFKYMFNDAYIERIGNYISFKTSTNLKLEEMNNNIEISDFACDNFKISIKFYNEVVNNNADEIDEKNNIYTWNVNKNSTKDYIEFKIGPKVRYDVMIKDYIYNNIFEISIVGSLLLIILIVTIFIVYKSKKNNEI